MRPPIVASAGSDDSMVPVAVLAVEVVAEAMWECDFSGMYRPAVGYNDCT